MSYPKQEELESAKRVEHERADRSINYALKTMFHYHKVMLSGNGIYDGDAEREYEDALTELRNFVLHKVQAEAYDRMRTDTATLDRLDQLDAEVAALAGRMDRQNMVNEQVRAVTHTQSDLIRTLRKQTEELEEIVTLTAGRLSIVHERVTEFANLLHQLAKELEDERSASQERG